MKKLFLFVAALAAGMSLFAQASYEKLTATPADWTGTYLIVCEGQGVVFNGAAGEDDIDAKGGPAILQNIVFEDDMLTGTAELDAAVFHIDATEDAEWPWSIRSASGLYIGHKDTVDNGLSVELELKGKCKHTLAIDESGNLIATPKWKDSGEYNLQYNKKADQMRFRYFVPGDKQAIQIYKLVEGTTALGNTQAGKQSQKRIENGQIVIFRGGQKFNILGGAM